MSFKFNCPYCNQRIEAEDEWNGLQTACPTCGKTIKIQKEVEPKLVAVNEENSVAPTPESSSTAPQEAPQDATPEATQAEPQDATPEATQAAPQTTTNEPEQSGKKTNVVLHILLAIFNFLKKTLDWAALKIGNFINKKSKKDFNPLIPGYLVIGLVVLICVTIFSQLNLGSKISTAVACLIDREGYYMEQADIAMQCENYNKSLQIYQEWAAKDSAEANYKLGSFYLIGSSGVEQDIKKGFTYLEKATKLGSPYAKLLLGELHLSVRAGYFNKKLGDKYLNESIQELKKLAAAKDNIAILQLAECYKHGLGVKEDFFSAFQLTKRAAESGYALAQNLLSKMYYLGEGVPKNSDLSLKWCIKSAEQNCIPGQMKLGEIYLIEKEYEKSFKWYSKAAAQGQISCQGILGGFYQKGYFVEKNLQKAAECYLTAASQGNAGFQYMYAKCLEEGSGVEKNWEAAVDWYRKAARNGNSDAQEKLESRGISW